MLQGTCALLDMQSSKIAQSARVKFCFHKPLPGAGTSTVMAELVRQVTSSCAERGRALAATWNLHVGLTDALTGISYHVSCFFAWSLHVSTSKLVNEHCSSGLQAAQAHRLCSDCHGPWKRGQSTMCERKKKLFCGQHDKYEVVAWLCRCAGRCKHSAVCHDLAAGSGHDAAAGSGGRQHPPAAGDLPPAKGAASPFHDDTALATVLLPSCKFRVPILLCLMRADVVAPGIPERA